ncbi:nuclease-related domain-containing protein [Terrimicrobium sacchariphilum]|uniref:Nuclease-related domain-containing protein n=2 Tax=Terrimicrobium sacchariphilum TaxID=690879 RepID=A0A146GBW3_TERSA|nr:nuclease-related domain-containing protein [Terrimicrobium sacchariphilum]
MVLFVVCALAPYAVGLLLLVIKGKRSKERWPEDFKLLRAPGETLRRKIFQMDENVPQNAFLFVFVPWVIAWLILWGLPKLGKVFVWPSLILAALVLIVGLVVSCRWVYGSFIKRRDYLLGYMGERAVGEWLATLPREYRVFHDVPVDEGKGAFNLDHVVVGPTGLFAIETKTRRKGRAREGFADHKVFYDGRQLIWPWAEDTYGLQQATNEAEWLTKWIRQMTGLDIAARPVLALPGWWVETRTPGPVAVQNPKNLPTHILGKGLCILDPQQVDLIARQLDSRCRDVKD